MQSRMDNPETLATLDTQDTGRRQSQHKTQDEDNHNTKHRTTTITTQNTGRRQSQHKTQDEDNHNTRHRTTNITTQDTGRRQSQHKTQDEDNHNTRHRTKTITTQHRKQQTISNMDPTKTRDQPWCSQKVISFSYIHLYSQVRWRSCWW